MRTSFKAAIADIILIVALYLVVQDVQWRSSYAASKGLDAAYLYSVFTHFFQMSKTGVLLQSPPTLDWIELLLAILLVLNLSFAYGAFRKGKQKAKDTISASVPA